VRKESACFWRSRLVYRTRHGHRLAKPRPDSMCGRRCSEEYW